MDRFPESTLILGAGLAGLSCAWHLRKRGASATLLEAENRPGGLARSESREGFTFDLTGHWLHVGTDGIRELVLDLLGEDAVEVRRRAWVHFQARWVPYPFQTNLWALPPGVRDDCVREFPKSVPPEGGTSGAGPDSFRDFVLRRFGGGIARHFLLPYSEKLWGLPAEELAAGGTARFVPVPDRDSVVNGAAGPGDDDGDGDGYNRRFLYPREGGIGRLAELLASRLDGTVRLGARVTAIDLVRRSATLSSGRTVAFDRLVSTLPLPSLAALVRDVPAGVSDAAGRLRARAVTCVNVAVRSGGGPAGEPRHWVYFPEPRYPFYRAGCFSDAVPSLAPPGCRAVWAEVSHAPGDAVNSLEPEVIRALRACGLLRPDDEVLFAFSRTLPHAYVVFDHRHAPSRRTVLDWLSSRGVVSSGRYGRWDYGSMEDALLDGKRAADDLLRKDPG